MQGFNNSKVSVVCGPVEFGALHLEIVDVLALRKDLCFGRRDDQASRVADLGEFGEGGLHVASMLLLEYDVVGIDSRGDARHVSFSSHAHEHIEKCRC